MEFVLYATIIAGTTKTPTQELCGHCDDDTTTSSSSPVPELLYCFFSATRDCIRLFVYHTADTANSNASTAAVAIVADPTTNQMVIHNLLLRGKGRV